MKTDLLIIGSGPAGLQAAIHASRQKVNVIVVGKIEKSSLKRAKVENDCCMDLFLYKGEDLLERGRRQCEKLGVVFIEDDVLNVGRKSDAFFYTEIENGEEIQSKAIIIATGVATTKLGVVGENEYQGKGVTYCVDCDAGFFKDKKVAVVGDGSAAASGAMLLDSYAKEVYLVSKCFDVSKKLRSQLNLLKIIQIDGQQIAKIEGDGNKVTGILFENGKRLEVDGVFIELGSKGAAELFNLLGIVLDQEKFCYIETNKKQETNIEGIYAAGDICGAPFQLAKAVGEGCIAGICASDYIGVKKIN